MHQGSHQYQVIHHHNLCPFNFQTLEIYLGSPATNHQTPLPSLPQPSSIVTYTTFTASTTILIGTGLASHLIQMESVSFHPHPLHPLPSKSYPRSLYTLPSLPTPPLTGSTCGVYVHVPYCLKLLPIILKLASSPSSSVETVAKHPGLRGSGLVDSVFA